MKFIVALIVAAAHVALCGDIPLAKPSFKDEVDSIEMPCDTLSDKFCATDCEDKVDTSTSCHGFKVEFQEHECCTTSTNIASANNAKCATSGTYFQMSWYDNPPMVPPTDVPLLTWFSGVFVAQDNPGNNLLMIGGNKRMLTEFMDSTPATITGSIPGFLVGKSVMMHSYVPAYGLTPNDNQKAYVYGQPFGYELLPASFMQSPFMLTFQEADNPVLVITPEDPVMATAMEPPVYIKDVRFYANKRINYVGEGTRSFLSFFDGGEPGDVRTIDDFSPPISFYHDSGSWGTLVAAVDFRVTAQSQINGNSPMGHTIFPGKTTPEDTQYVIVECYDLECKEMDLVVSFGALGWMQDGTTTDVLEGSTLGHHVSARNTSENDDETDFATRMALVLGAPARTYVGLADNTKLPECIQERIRYANLQHLKEPFSFHEKKIIIPAPAPPPYPPAQPDVGWMQIGTGFCRKQVPDTLFSADGTRIAKFSDITETGKFDTTDDALRFCLLNNAACCSILVDGGDRRALAYGYGPEGAAKIVNSTLGGEYYKYKTFVPNVLPPSPPMAAASPPPPMPVFEECAAGSVRVKMWGLVSDYAEEATIELRDGASSESALVWQSGFIFADGGVDMTSTCVAKDKVYITALDSYGDGWGNGGTTSAHFLIVVVGDKYKTIAFCNPGVDCAMPFNSGASSTPVVLTVKDTSTWGSVSNFPVNVPYP